MKDFAFDYHIIDDFLAFNCSIMKVSDICLCTYSIYKANVGAQNFDVYLLDIFLRIASDWLLNCHTIPYGAVAPIDGLSLNNL